MRTLFECRGGNIYRNKKQIIPLTQERFNDLACLLRTAAAELDQRRAVGNLFNYFVGVPAENLVLSPGQIIFIYLTNRFKQTRPNFIVEIFREEMLWI